MSARMKAYPDSKCAWGYKMVCGDCVNKAVNSRSEAHIDFANPIVNPPAVNKFHPCEICGKKRKLTSARQGNH